MLRIREARRKDLRQLEALYDAFLAHNAEKQPDFYRAVPVERAYPRSLIGNRKAALLVAADDAAREITGFIHVAEAKTPPYEAYVPYHYAIIVDLYVAPGHRDQGIGRALVESARNWADARDLAYLELMVLEDDIAARTFYRQVGFGVANRTMRSPARREDLLPDGPEGPASPAMEAEETKDNLPPPDTTPEEPT